MLEIKARIESIKYKPTLADELQVYSIVELQNALKKPCFMLRIDNNTEYAVSQWVSPKRTRSYPYARVYRTLLYSGRKVTLIPVLKDEGINGDRDFIQWDTIALMSLLQVYVILVYYISAEKNTRREGKITNQNIDLEYLKNHLKELANYKSDALHWNMEQSKHIAKIMTKALDSYDVISKQLKIVMHNRETAITRIESIKSDYEFFKDNSRSKAIAAQRREASSVQPKENIDKDSKAIITIRNFLNGVYFLTADEAHLENDVLSLVEAKHTKQEKLPSKDDIIDGCVKMILFTNLAKVEINEKSLRFQAVLKLSNPKGIAKTKLSKNDSELLRKLEIEAETNNFRLQII